MDCGCDNFGMFVVSVTTYPKRFGLFRKSFSNMMEMFLLYRALKIVVVVDDNLSEDDYGAYEAFLGRFEDCRIELMISDAKWRSANKLIPVYNKYGRDCSIVCFDDDKIYPKACLAQLLRAYSDYPAKYGVDRDSFVVAQEINPLIVAKDGSVGYFNDLDVKIGQYEHGKFLSNACLFPKGCFGDGKLLNDYDKFSYVTNGTHDELWFWAVATISGVGSVGLSHTMAYFMDGGVCLDCDGSLTDINSRQSEVDGYDSRLNETLGKEMTEAMKGRPVRFFVTSDSYLATLYGMNNIFCLYNGQTIEFLVDESLPESFHAIFRMTVSAFEWRSPVMVVRKEFSRKHLGA